MLMVLGGLAGGCVAGMLLARRGRAIGVSYGVLVTGMAWAVPAFMAARNAQEMAAIPYLVAGATAFWFVALPGAAAVLVLEIRRARGSGRHDR